MGPVVTRSIHGRLVRLAVATGCVTAAALSCSRNDGGPGAASNLADPKPNTQYPDARFYEFKGRRIAPPIVFKETHPRQVRADTQDRPRGADFPLIPLATRTPGIPIPTTFSAQVLLLSRAQWNTREQYSRESFPANTNGGRAVSRSSQVVEGFLTAPRLGGYHRFETNRQLSNVEDTSCAGPR